MPSNITKSVQSVFHYAFYRWFVHLLEYSFLFCLTHILPNISLVMEKFVRPREHGPISVTRIM